MSSTSGKMLFMEYRPSVNQDRVRIENLLNPIAVCSVRGRTLPSERRHDLGTCVSARDILPNSLSNESDGSQTRIGTANHSSEPRQKRKRYWTQKEDELLEKLIARHGATNWARLAKHFEERTAAQLRARWAHSLCDSLCKRPYTSSEDEFILTQYAAIGSQWTTIASMMQNRVGNGVKNRFATLRKRREILLSANAAVPGSAFNAL